MRDYKAEILQIISHYFKNEKKALTWYDTPHKLLDDTGKSPKDMVDSGRGEEVLNWIKMVLDV